MTVKRFLVFLSMLVLQSAYGQGTPVLPCAQTQRRCLVDALRSHVVKQWSGWSAAWALPRSERMGPASPPLVEFLNLDNMLAGYSQRPVASRLDESLLTDTRAALQDIPEAVWAAVGERFAGLYFVDGLGGTGYTDTVLDGSGKPVAAFVVLDAAVLSALTANAWASWKENTPFKAHAGYRLEARIEADDQDNRKNAIAYILLHELGHVLSVGTHIHPPWNVAPKSVEATTRFPFFDLSWRVDHDANQYFSAFDADFSQRQRTVYYRDARLEGDEMLATYRALEKTNFPSLYAATGPGDDFAESFVSYVHVVLQKRPWQIRISQEGQETTVLHACWGETRCADKAAFLAQLLKSPRD